MDHGGEAARLTTMESTDLGMAGAVQGGEANMSSGTFHGQLGAATARRAGINGFQPSAGAAAVAYHNSIVFAHHVRSVPVAVFHREPGPGVAYANIGAADAVLVGLQLRGRVVPVHDSYFYSALQPGPGARPGVVLAALRPGGVGAVYSGDYALQPFPGAGHSEVLVDLLADDAGQGHGQSFLGQLPGWGIAAYDDYGYYMWQPSPATGRGEVFVGPLPDGAGAVFDNSGNFFALAQQTLPGIGRAEGIAGALRARNLGAGYDGSGALAGAAYNNLSRLLPLAGIGACSVAVNGLAAGPGSSAVAFHLFVLLLAGLFLVILHVLRV